MKEAEKGDRVIVHFTSRTSHGKIFEESDKKEPLEIIIGDGSVNPAFEEALIKMKPGDKKEILLCAKKAYGEYKKRLVFKLRKSGLNLLCDPKPGDMVLIKLPTGQKSLVSVVEVTAKSIKVDANHPMAGEDMIYEIELVDILPAKDTV